MHLVKIIILVGLMMMLWKTRLFPGRLERYDRQDSCLACKNSKNIQMWFHVKLEKKILNGLYCWWLAQQSNIVELCENGDGNRTGTQIRNRPLNSPTIEARSFWSRISIFVFLYNFTRYFGLSICDRMKNYKNILIQNHDLFGLVVFLTRRETKNEFGVKRFCFKNAKSPSGLAPL